MEQFEKNFKQVLEQSQAAEESKKLQAEESKISETSSAPVQKEEEKFTLITTKLSSKDT